MKSLTKILTFIALLISSVTFGQTINKRDTTFDLVEQLIDKCDTIYDFVDKMPKYEKDLDGLMNYLNKELVPVVSDCMKRDGDVIASLHIILTIDKSGKVINATFPRPNLTIQCKNDLKKKLLTMTGWTSGQQNGQNVCCRFYWPISCIYWKE